MQGRSFLKIGFLLALGVFSVSGWSQPATPEQMGRYPDNTENGTIHLQTLLGSFRALDCDGRLEFTFTGTVLVNDLADGGTLNVTGNVKKEYDDNGRVVYFGTGRVVVEGKWRAVQWFGSDMKAVFYGKGLMRVNGEFDRNQKTGEYWYEDDTFKMPWPAASSRDVVVPGIRATGKNDPVIRKRGESGGN